MSRDFQTKLGETHSRTVIKTISWRIIASLTTMLIVYLFTRKWGLSLGVGGLEVVSKIIFYYLHERAWSSVGWGKKEHPLADIPITKELSPDDRTRIEDQLRNMGYME